MGISPQSILRKGSVNNAYSLMNDSNRYTTFHSIKVMVGLETIGFIFVMTVDRTGKNSCAGRGFHFTFNRI